MDTTISTTGLMTEPGIRWEELSVVPSIPVSYHCNALTLHSNMLVAIVSSLSMKSGILGFLPVYGCMSSISLVSWIIAVRFVNCPSEDPNYSNLLSWPPIFGRFDGDSQLPLPLPELPQHHHWHQERVCLPRSSLLLPYRHRRLLFDPVSHDLTHRAVSCPVTSRHCQLSWYRPGLVCFPSFPVVTRYY